MQITQTMAVKPLGLIASPSTNHSNAPLFAGSGKSPVAKALTPLALLAGLLGFAPGCAESTNTNQIQIIKENDGGAKVRVVSNPSGDVVELPITTAKPAPAAAPIVTTTAAPQGQFSPVCVDKLLGFIGTANKFGKLEDGQVITEANLQAARNSITDVSAREVFGKLAWHVTHASAGNNAPLKLTVDDFAKLGASDGDTKISLQEADDARKILKK